MIEGAGAAGSDGVPVLDRTPRRGRRATDVNILRVRALRGGHHSRRFNGSVAATQRLALALACGGERLHDY